MKRALFVFLLLATSAWRSHASADTTISYSLGGGSSSNIFKDTNNLSARYGEAGLELRGSLDLESSSLSYAAGLAARRVGRYRFGDLQRVNAELGYRIDLSEAARIALRTAISHKEDGDLFLAIPGAIVGYRTRTIGMENGIGGSFDAAGGTTALAADYTTTNRGKARFTLRGVHPVRLESDEDLLDLTAHHIRPMLGGEAGVYIQHRKSFVPGSDRLAFARFPAETLRGSIAFGRKLGQDVKLLGEIGLVRLSSPYVSDSVQRQRPFLKVELEWSAPKDITLAARFKRDTVITGLDDALAEDTRSIKFAMEKALTERIKAGASFERAFSDWFYYDYRTRTDSLTATVTVALSKKTALAFEASRLIRRESDKAADFTIDGLATRLSGSF